MLALYFDEAAIGWVHNRLNGEPILIGNQESVIEKK